MAADQLKRNEDLREEFTFGPDSLLTTWKNALIREAMSPASQMSKQDLAVAHQVIERLLEVIDSIDKLPRDQT